MFEVKCIHNLKNWITQCFGKIFKLGCGFIKYIEATQSSNFQKA